MSQSLRSNFLRLSLLALGASLSIALTGCGMGSVAMPGESAARVAQPISGVIHGGPNPVVGARVVLYATTANGYGVGTPLVEATPTVVGTHLDTTATGSFQFAGGFTCPANSYSYVVAYGGNSGAGNNPNSVLMAAVGPCTSITTSTNIWVDELTTVAAGYALSNFIGITGNSVAGYTVGVGADATNAALTGCVANAYYGSGCTATTGAGMAHAFTTATNLVNITTGQANLTTTNGAIIPAQLLNTLANVLQACVNSTGGGTSTTTGLPTTTTTTAGATHDGTPCGRLSAYTSYTTTNTTSGTSSAAGNTLGFIQNLAKHPTGTPATFNSTCDSASGTSGTTTAASCIFNLAQTIGFYSVSMTAAPTDWTLALFYPKTSFSSTANTTACASGSVPATTGLLYPYMVATDINDNVAILNGDANTIVCYNLITIGFDGTPLAANAFDSTGQQVSWIANDSFGHTIVPAHPSSGTTGGSIRVYSTGPDSAINLVNTITSTTSMVAADPWFIAVDGNDNIYADSQAGVAGEDFGYIFLNGGNSHTAPAYTGGSVGTSTSKGLQVAIDINSNIFWETSSSSGTTRPFFTNAGGTATFTQAPNTDEGAGSSSNGFVTFPDTSGGVWIAYTPASSAPGQGTQVNDVVFKTPYTVAAGAVTYGATPSIYNAGTAVPSTDYKLEGGSIDGNNVIWWTDLQAQTLCNGTTCPTQTTPYTAPPTPVVFNTSALHGFDTVNTAYVPTLFGCVFTYTTSTACGSQPTDQTGSYAYPSSYPYAFYGSRGLAVDSAGNIWTANGTQGHLTEVIGLAAPTWPMFIHNGTSNKP